MTEFRRPAYQYGIDRHDEQPVERVPTKRIAISTAARWCNSPLRTAPRYATVLRRRGWDGAWTVLEEHRGPEAYGSPALLNALTKQSPVM